MRMWDFAQVHPAAEHPWLCAGSSLPLQHVVARAAVCGSHAGNLVCGDCLPPGSLLQGADALHYRVYIASYDPGIAKVAC